MRKLLLVLLLLCSTAFRLMAQHPTGIDDRAYWVSTLTRIVDPVMK